MSPLVIAMSGKYAGPMSSAVDKRIPLSAPAGQKILWRLDAKIDAISQARTAVSSPWMGVPPLAMARDMESGMFTMATINAAFRFCQTSFVIFLCTMVMDVSKISF